jgi:hypothetical protein
MMSIKKEFKLVFPRKRFMVIGRKGMALQRIDFEKRNPVPIWLTIKKYLNSLSTNQQFTRQHLLKIVYTEETAKYIECTSIDFYRNLLHRLEYIETVRPGVYIKKHDIPENAPLSLIRQFARNSESWKEWFMPTEDRRQKIKEMCENALLSS